MEKIPTAKEVMAKHLNVVNVKPTAILDGMIEFAKLHVEQALKEVVNNAEIDDYDKHMQYSPSINENSILNSYPLDKIK